MLPSYFFAISFRCQANSVSGVTIVAICLNTVRLSFFCSGCKAATLMVGKSHAALADLLAKNSILFDEIFRNTTRD